jgi:ComF family protein
MSALQPLLRAGRLLPSLLWPDRCAACDALGAGPFCDPCSTSLVPCPAGCPCCGAPAEEELLPALRPRRCCHCRRTPPPFARASAPWLHGGALAEAVHRLKYEGRSDLAAPLGVLFAGADPPAADVVAPIPLHSARLRQRGYDQAFLLAREAAGRLGVPLRLLLTRVRATGQQIHLDRPARERNVRGAFIASREAAGKRVCLVDDVLTTGATAAAAALALLRAGAVRVEVRTLARAP